MTKRKRKERHKRAPALKLGDTSVKGGQRKKGEEEKN